MLCFALPQTRIFVGNLYVIRDFPVDASPAVTAYNQIVAGVAAFANAGYRAMARAFVKANAQ